MKSILNLLHPKFLAPDLRNELIQRPLPLHPPVATPNGPGQITIQSHQTNKQPYTHFIPIRQKRMNHALHPSQRRKLLWRLQRLILPVTTPNGPSRIIIQSYKTNKQPYIHFIPLRQKRMDHALHPSQRRKLLWCLQRLIPPLHTRKFIHFTSSITRHETRIHYRNDLQHYPHVCS